MPKNAEFKARITAEDDASKVLDDVAEKAERLESDDTEITVGADTSDAERDIEGLITKVDKLGRGDAANILLATNSAAITDDIIELTTKLDALDANDPQVDVTVANITALQGDLDTVTAKLKEINDTPIQPGAGQQPGKGLTEIVDGAGQAESAVANMVGNSAQDLGQLAGVTGSAGVAVGQLAEYFADTAFKAKAAGQGMGEMTKTFIGAIGPIAAITAGVFLAKSAMDAYNKPTEDAEKRTTDLGEAMVGTGDDALAFAGVLRDNAAALQDFIANANDPLGGFGTAVDEAGSHIPLIGKYFKEAGVDVFKAMGDASLSVYDFARAMRDGGAGTDEFRQKLTAAKDAGKISGDEFRAVDEALGAYTKSAEQAAEDSGILNVSLDEANAILRDGKDPLEQYTELWGTLFEDLADGKVDTKEAADAINELAVKLGLSREEVIKLADEHVDEMAADAADEFEKAAEELKAWTEEYVEHIRKVKEADNAIADMDSSLSAIGGRRDALAQIFQLDTGPRDAASNLRDVGAAIDDLGEKAKGVNVGEALANSITADEFLDAVDALAPQVQEAVTNAFAGGGPQAGADMANSYIDQITEELGGAFTRDEVAEMMGLANIEATITAAVDEDSATRARRKLELLVGIGGDSVLAASIELALDAGQITPQVAEALVDQQLRGEGVTVPMRPELTLADLTAATEFAKATFEAMDPANIPVQADVAPAKATIGEVEKGKYSATIETDSDTRPATTDIAKVETGKHSTTITAAADTAKAAGELLDEETKLRKAIILAVALTVGASRELDDLLTLRTAPIQADVTNAFQINRELDELARPRSSAINVNIRQTSTLTRVDG